MALPIIGALIPILDKVLDKAIPDPIEKAKLSLELSKLADQEAARAHAEAMGQIGVNNTEAQHRSWLVAGWRPGIGWVGVLSLFMYYPVQIAVQLWQFGAVKLDVTDLLAIIAGLLGFGGMRSFDKLKGTANDAPLGKPVPAPNLSPVVVEVEQPKKKKGLWPF